ncbi:MAG: ATP-binding protein [Burkholderiaceae bacterium]
MTAPDTLAPAGGADRERARERERQIGERLNYQLFALERAARVGALLAALLLWSLFYFLSGRPQVFIWAALIHAVQGVRYYMLWRTERDHPADRHPGSLPPHAVSHVVPLLMAASIAWGLAPWILIPPGGPQAFAPVMIVILFGMMGASIAPIMPRRSAVLAWLAPITLMLALRFAWEGGTIGWIMCACTLLFGATIGRFALVEHRMQVAMIGAQLDNEALTGQVMAHARELQRLNQERNRFFASASHDLRQPVHALALFSRALQRDLAGHVLQPVADRVVQATDAVSGLLNAMLDISRIDAGTVHPNWALVAVDPIFLALAQQFEPPAHAAGITLRFHTGPQVLVTDADLVLRVLSNFIDNAIKYAGHGRGRGRMLVSARVRRQRLRLAVWDTGAGIAPEHLPHLFDEFYQVGNPQRDVAHGLGIGLAIVRRLAQLLDGEVGVRSRVGRGSVFWLELPRDKPLPPRPPAPAPVAAAAPATAPARPLRVLLLDDEAAVGEAIRLWLAPHCARLEITQALATATALVQADPADFDAFIVDFRLAGAQDGIAATAALRACAGRAVPTVLVTGDTDPARVRAAYASGLAAMFKPVQPEALLQLLLQLADPAALAQAMPDVNGKIALQPAPNQCSMLSLQ